MARPIKQGIDYFPADVDMFGDRKVKRLLRAAGGKGFTIYIYLLTNIYGDKGYFYEWDEYSAFDISDDLNFSEGVVEETVQACCSIGLFNEELFSAESVLTSESIQNRWQKIVKDANRSETRIEARVKIKDGKPMFLTKKTKLSTEETPEKSEETPQSKVKESKVKDIPPEISDVVDWLTSNKNFKEPLAKEIAKEFHSFYEMKDWKVGKNKMTKWEIALGRALKWDRIEKIINNGENRANAGAYEFF